ncbi:hypothetical protein SADUNF_Sadunf19G0080900 [Salix dunnii]|uniref:RRM domain-containing protein n=1 Tax=Salix dunnii TaxID=1413687 RepID=A0A835J646_9ROSI|nr:hypothetical protein SADUNF_Sadunf19G0080900 [Salix dunnii]
MINPIKDNHKNSITSAVMMRDADEKSKCFEFVNFKKAEDANEVVKTLNGKEIDVKYNISYIITRDRFAELDSPVVDSCSCCKIEYN